MEKSRRVTLSGAILVLVCFFLPWIQMSCGGFKDSQSGYDLAHGGHGSLWLIPLLMLALVLIGLRFWKVSAMPFAVLGTLGGLVSAYLMNRERVDAEQVSGLIQARVTGWFWL